MVMTHVDKLCHDHRQDVMQQQQQQHTSRASSEDGRDIRLSCEAQIAELQQLKADLLAAQTRLRDAGEFMVVWSKRERGGGISWPFAGGCMAALPMLSYFSGLQT